MTSKKKLTAINNTEKNTILMGHYSTTPKTNMRQQSNSSHWYQTPGKMMQGLINTLRTLGQFTVSDKHRKPALLMRCVFVLLMMGGMGASAQNVNVNPGAGTYPTLQAAFAAINAGTHTGAITVDVVGNTTETGSAVLNASGVGGSSYTSIVISPSGGVARTITGTLAAPLIDMNGATNVTLNGVNTGGNSLTISNTSTAATTGTSTIRFINDAADDVVSNCTILGSSTGTAAQNGAASSPTAATILFGTTTGANGNKNIAISNNNIADAGGALPVVAISSAGLSTAVPNTLITISGNNISNFYGAAGANGICIGSNSSAFTISSNKFFLTAAGSTLASANYWEAIFISTASGGSYSITDNTIGFANSTGTGMLTNSGGRFVGIDLFAVAATPVSSIQGNTINGINWTTASSAATAGAGIINPIIVKAGGVNIGTTTGNTIGATSGTGSSTSNLFLTTTTSGSGIYGIYVSSATACSISNNNIGAFATGGTAAMGYVFNGIVVAGAGGYTITSNNVGNSTAAGIALGIVGTSTAANTFIGILSSATGAETIGSTGSGNTIQNINLNAVATNAFTGISNTGAGTTVNIGFNTIKGIVFGATSATHASTFVGIANSAAVSTALSINNNSFGVSGTNLVTYNLTASAASGALTGINVSTGPTAAATLSISNNDFRGVSYTFAGSGSHTYISWLHANSGTDNINNNTFTNLDVNTSGSVTFMNRSTSSSMTATSVLNINSNSIVTGFNKGTAGGTVTFYTNGSGATSVAGSTITCNLNNFSNVTLTGATAVLCWSEADGTTTAGAGPTKIITNNTFNNITTGVAQITGISYGFAGNNCSISNNTLSNLTGGGVILAIASGTTNGSGVQTHTISGNALTNFTAGGQINGIQQGATAIGTFNVTNNTLRAWSTSGAANPVFCVIISSGVTTNISKNKITDISSDNAGGTVTGILVQTAGTTKNINNNIIGDLRAPSANAANAVIGISTQIGTCNVYYNTVYLNASSTGALFGTSCLSTSTTPTLDLSNNLFVNTSTPKGAGLSVAYRRSSTTLTTYATTSNRNDFFAPTIFTDGTNSFSSMGPGAGTYINFVSTRDANSFSAAASFLSTTPGSVNLKINTATPTRLESGAANIAGITDDFENDIRQGNAGYPAQVNGGGTAPDIGADEFDGIPVPVCSGTPASTTITGAASVCSGTGTTLSLGNPFLFLGISYQWASSTTSGSGYTNLGTAASQATGNLSVTTYYICTITCSNGGGTFTTPEFTVTVNALPTVGVNPTSGTYCSPGGTAVTLNGTGASTYSWSPAAGLSATTGSSVLASPSASTTYTVTGTDGNGCVNTATTTITVLVKPSGVTATATPSSICTGLTSSLTSTGSASNTATLASGMLFAGSTGTYTTITGTSLAGALGDDVAVGNLPIGFTFIHNGTPQTVFAAASNGFLELGSTLTYANNSAAGWTPSTNALTGRANIIAPLWEDNNTTGGTVIYATTGTPGSQVLTVQWTGMHVGGTGSGSNPTINVQVKLYEGSNKIEFIYGATSAALSGTTASIGLSGAVGNFLSVTPLSPASTSTTSTVTENTTISSATNFPTGTVYTFTEPSFALTYAWDPAADVVNPNAQNTATVVLTGTKLYTVTASNGACSTTATATVTVNPLPTATLTGGAVYCAGSIPDNVVANTTGTGPWSIAFTLNGVAQPAATGPTSPISLGNAAGVYVVTGVTDANCSNTGGSTQTISFDPAPTANAGTDIASCVSGPPVFTVTGTIGGSASTATWSTNGGGSFSSTTWDGLGQTYTVGGSDLAGPFPKLVTITLTTNAPGACPAAISSLVITLNQVPSLVTTPASFCSGGNADLAAHVTDNNSTTGTLAYYPTLSDAQNETNAISSVVTTAGTYYIRKNTSTVPSCDDIASVVVTQNPDYTITASAGSNGAINPNGITTICSGSDQSYTITPDPCYHVVDIVVDGNPQGPGTNYSFTNITVNHTINVTFAINTYTLTYTAGTGGSVTGTLVQTVNCGADGSAVTAAANPGYHFVNWSDLSISNPRTDAGVNADISVTANFQINCPAVAHNVNLNTDYCTIQEAIDAANTGDQINVVAGTFTENVNVNKSVTLNGAGSGLTKITSVTTNGNVLTVAANDVTISNMQLEGTLVSGSSATRGIYINSTISNLHVTNVLSSLHQFALFADDAAVVTGLTILNSQFASSGNGIQVSAGAHVSNLSMTGGSVDNNLYGMASNAQYQDITSTNVNNATGLDGVTVTGTSFTGNQYKGLYFEKIQNALFDGITVSGNGLANTGVQESGMDINLKFGTYSNIEIRNSTFSGNATNNDNGAGLLVKARTVGGGGTYGLNPATLNNVSIHHNNIVNNGGSGLYTSGLRIGESNNSVTGAGEAGPTGVEIHYNGFTGNTNFAIRNAATGSVNASCNWYGTNNLATITGMLSMSPGTITYIPHLTSGDNDLGTNGFQTSETCLACDPVIAGSYGPVCVDAADITLVGSPAGGVWTGTGVSGDQLSGFTFDPSVGTQTLNYSYDGLNGCSGTDNTTITVNPLPTVSFSGLAGAYCIDAASATLTANHGGGIFSGAGITDNGDGTATFSPAGAGAGTFSITYTYTDGNSCSATTNQPVTVNALPVVSFTGLAALYCVDAASATLTANHAAGVFSGAGITDNGNGTASFSPAAAGVGGPYTITYSYSDGNSCNNSTSQTVSVTALPVVSFTGLTATACTTGGTQTLTGNMAPAGTFSGTGITDNGNGTASFDPAAAGVGGPYTITYTYSDGNSCSGSSSQTVTVSATPAAPSIAVVNNHDGTSTLTAGGLAGGATLLWSTTQTINPIVVNAPGTYTVTQTANGCTSAAGSAVVAPDIYADPAITGLDLTDMGDASISANAVAYNQVVKLKVPVFNLNQDNFVPSGSTKLTIDLGTKFVVDPGFTLATAPLSAYFAWTQATVSGHVIITGNQVADIPADFADLAVFQVVGTTSCTSTISANFVVDNHASTIFLVDEDAANNVATLQYTVVTPAPTVTTTQPTCAIPNGTITITAPIQVGMTYTIDATVVLANVANEVAPGSHSVVAHTADGCNSAATVVVTDPQPVTPVITLGTVVNNSCHGGTTGSITVTSDAIPTFSYTISPAVNTTGATSGVFTDLPAGTYTVTVLSGSGCSSSVVVDVTEPSGTVANLSLGADYDANIFLAVGNENTVVYNISEIAGNPAVGDTIRISKVAGYTLTFDDAATSVTIGATTYTLDNTRWTVDATNPSFISIILDPPHTGVTPGIINCQEHFYLSVKFKRNTPNISTFSLSARVRKTNGETDLTNNLNSIVFTAE